MSVKRLPEYGYVEEPAGFEHIVVLEDADQRIKALIDTDVVDYEPLCGRWLGPLDKDDVSTIRGGILCPKCDQIRQKIFNEVHAYEHRLWAEWKKGRLEIVQWQALLYVAKGQLEPVIEG